MSTESPNPSGGADGPSSGDPARPDGQPHGSAGTGKAAEPTAAPTPSKPPKPPKPPTPFTQQLGRVVVVLLVVAFGVFAFANSHHVDFSWLVGGTTVTYDAGGERLAGGVPLIALMIASLAIGILVGALLSWQGSRAKRRAAQKRATGTKKGDKQDDA